MAQVLGNKIETTATYSFYSFASIETLDNKTNITNEIKELLPCDLFSQPPSNHIDPKVISICLQYDDHALVSS